MKPQIKIDVVSDVVCPWCYIGKRRLEKAIAQLQDDYTVKVNYLPFQLSPDTPTEGENTKERLSAKFGGEDRYFQVLRQVTSVAAEEGLQFNLENQAVSPNTRRLHRLVWYAQQQEKQLPMVEALFKAYFEDAVNLADVENVVSLAEKVGLDATSVRELMTSDRGEQEVEQLLYQNHLMGVSAVPYYIINDKYAVSGAQPTALFLQALPDIALKAPIAVAAGETCDLSLGAQCG
jgi:predicted DsbA family dithiol-disulfide isomerase